MNKAIVGRKLGMSQVFEADGVAVPVTVVEAGPCPIVQVKTVEKDGYKAVKIAFQTAVKRDSSNAKKKNSSVGEYKGVDKPTLGQYKKAEVEPMRYMREVDIESVVENGVSVPAEVGKVVTVSCFNNGDMVDVVGTTRGRGYTGVIQRWNAQRIGPMSHGTGPIHRSVGSMSAHSDPSRVFKNKHMAGQYGHERVTIQNLRVVKVDQERNLLLIKGAIPGPKGGLVMVKSTVKKSK